MKLLFVCSSNFIRSPFAEQRMKMALLGAEALHTVEVSSAGAFAGLEPRTLSKRVTDEAMVHGVDLSAHRTRSTNLPLLLGSDLVLPMDEDSHWFVIEELRGQIAAEQRVRRFVSFVPDLSLREVADPIIDGNPYDETYALIDRGVLAIKSWLLRSLPKV